MEEELFRLPHGVYFSDGAVWGRGEINRFGREILNGYCSSCVSRKTCTESSKLRRILGMDLDHYFTHNFYTVKTENPRELRVFCPEYSRGQGHLPGIFPTYIEAVERLIERIESKSSRLKIESEAELVTEIQVIVNGR